MSSASFLAIQVGGMVILAILALIILIWRSSKITDPILNLSLFKDHRFTAHIIAFFVIQFISLGNAFLLPNFMQLINHNTALTAGLIVLPADAAGAIMIIYIVYMAGMGMAFGNIMTDTLDGYDATKRTEGNAILNTVQQFAGAVGTQHAYWLLLILNIIIWVLLFKKRHDILSYHVL